MLCARTHSCEVCETRDCVTCYHNPALSPRGLCIIDKRGWCVTLIVVHLLDLSLSLFESLTVERAWGGGVTQTKQIRETFVHSSTTMSLHSTRGALLGPLSSPHHTLRTHLGSPCSENATLSSPTKMLSAYSTNHERQQEETKKEASSTWVPQAGATWESQNSS